MKQLRGQEGRIINRVYIVEHCYEYKISRYVKQEDVKVIGIYSAYEKAEQAVERYKTKRGFSLFPEDCFYISEYELDQDHWKEGFITYDGSTGEWIE